MENLLNNKRCVRKKGKKAWNWLGFSLLKPIAKGNRKVANNEAHTNKTVMIGKEAKQKSLNPIWEELKSSFSSIFFHVFPSQHNIQKINFDKTLILKCLNF